MIASLELLTKPEFDHTFVRTPSGPTGTRKRRLLGERDDPATVFDVELVPICEGPTDARPPQQNLRQASLGHSDLFEAAASNARRELFAQMIAEGEPAQAAYKRAGSNLFGRAIDINGLPDRHRSNKRFRTVFRTAISGIDAEGRRSSDGRIRKAVAAVVPNLAKVGVEGTNPFARSSFLFRKEINDFERSFGAVCCFPALSVRAGEAWGKHQKA